MSIKNTIKIALVMCQNVFYRGYSPRAQICRLIFLFSREMKAGNIKWLLGMGESPNITMVGSMEHALWGV